MNHSRRLLRPWKRPVALRFPPPILHERYALEQEVGHGGSARVYRAWDLRRRLPVALKRAHLSQQDGEALCYEAELLSALRHPALPAFVEYFEEGGRAYLVETWMAGTTLTHRRAVSVPQALWIGCQLCDVLTYLHRHHLVHRDLAPGNILLADNQQTLALLDLGQARLFLPSPHLNDAPALLDRQAGTPGYVAPEQWEEGIVSPAADIYGLGMVLGCALTMCPPSLVVAASSFTQVVDDPRDLSPAMTQVLRLCDQMIAWHPEHRPTLADVSQALIHLQTDLPSTRERA
ncbi:MAG TPA: serine/threonine-protein kinase [Ktedonobacteraceae bacterium]|nr:serine/threonine-protein kinase [Ktedonobacteraceae bacterium]